MKLATTITVIVFLLCTINARSVSQNLFEKRNSIDDTNSAKLSSGDTQKTSEEVSEDKDLSNASTDAVKVTNITGDTVSTIQLSESLRNKILDGVKKATQQKDITTLLDSITGILGSDNISPTPNSNQSPTPNLSTGQSGPLNSNSGAGTPNGIASIAESSPNISGPNVGQPCPCSCLCGSGLIPNGPANSPSLTPDSTTKAVAGKGVILSDGGCGCSCSCPAAAFSNTPGLSSPNTAAPLVAAAPPVPVAAAPPAAVAPPAAPAPVQGQSPKQSLPAIISQQTPGQNPPAAASGQSPPAAPAPAEAQSQAQGQSSNSSNPSVAANPAQAANQSSDPRALPSVPIAVSPPASTQPPAQLPDQISAQAQIDGALKENPLNIQSFSLTSSLNLGNLVAVPTSIPK